MHGLAGLKAGFKGQVLRAKFDSKFVGAEPILMTTQPDHAPRLAIGAITGFGKHDAFDGPGASTL